MTTKAHETSLPPLTDWAIPPGEYLAEVLEDLNMTQADLSRRMGRPAQAINELIKGEKELTPETALQLAQVVGVPAHIWTGLENDYRLILARQTEQKKIKEERDLLKRFPLGEMAQWGFIKIVRDKAEQVIQLRQFFGVATLTAIPNVSDYKPAFRKQEGKKDHSYAITAWLQAGKHQAAKQATAEFQADALATCTTRIRHLSCEDPAKSIPKLKAQLADCGVALVPLPHFKGTGVHGAVFWEKRNGVDRAVVLVTLRRKYSDTFWFTLLHELGHVLLHKPDRRKVFLDVGGTSAQEDEANAFAASRLLPLEAYTAFVEAGDFSQTAIQSFAARESICPGIVVGRLQKEKIISYRELDHLRVRYEFSAEDFAES
ncbi:HigA family addiction module antitoxin [Deinococcus sp. Marseille-Q6407]|uniref:HigA family addiction module antitoxin n=1 Tax=Deinococcus sp. Marseille-Q6407 TaxID=2969223 RepID=UPI0021C0910C|nr:HigA family addiction module antitoxin [Deinococcus sp. Marseille-Q6407]